MGMPYMAQIKRKLLVTNGLMTTWWLYTNGLGMIGSKQPFYLF
jgi:hypothetical protein